MNYVRLSVRQRLLSRWTRAIIFAAFSATFMVGCPADDADLPSVFRLTKLDLAELEYDEARFRSVIKDDRLSRQVTMGGRTELSLTPLVPSRLQYRLQVPDKPVLRLSVALSTLGAGELRAPADMVVIVEANGVEETVLEHRFPIRESEPHTDRWWDRDVDLSRWAGEKVTVTLASRWAVDRAVRQPVLAVWGDPIIAGEFARPRTPNLVLISIDCLRADHVGAYGYPRDTTPNLDRIAAESEIYELAFSTASWTLPAHMSMLTGELPSFHGATKWEKLDGSVPYLPELLADAGYRTTGIVSWVYLSQAYGFERGFHDYQVLAEPEANEIVDKAIAQLERGAGQNQFLFIHLYDPHWPYLPPSELIDRFGPRPDDLSQLFERIENGDPPSEKLSVDEAIRLYDGEIAFVDRELRRFFEALEARGLYDETLVVVTADHGEAFYEHGHWQHSYTLFDEVTRVPLIVKWPASARRGRREEPVSLVDVFATLLSAAGVSIPGQELGSRARLLGDADPNRAVVSEFTTRSPDGTSLQISFRTKALRYVATLAGPVGDDLGVSELRREELYDLLADPEERIDVASERDSDVGRFRDELRTFLEAARLARSGRHGEEVELDDETLRQLKSLGYLHCSVGTSYRSPLVDPLP